VRGAYCSMVHVSISSKGMATGESSGFRAARIGGGIDFSAWFVGTTAFSALVAGMRRGGLRASRVNPAIWQYVIALIILLSRPCSRRRARLAMLPQGHAGLTGCGREFEIELTFRLQHQMRLMCVDRAGSRSSSSGSPGNQRLERVGEVMDVIDDEASSAQDSADHGRKSIRKPSRWRRARGPPGQCHWPFGDRLCCKVW